ncbi:MAG TPA: hypothetical protein DET46_17165 [Comamonadaceae bacterium]|nr:hypothetical protein [Comamonadaceae bacterium]
MWPRPWWTARTSRTRCSRPTSAIGRRKRQPPERLRRFPLLLQRCALRKGDIAQRGGAALARRPLAWAARVQAFGALFSCTCNRLG